MTHAEAIAMLSSQIKISFCEAPEKTANAFFPCILKKIVIPYNHWELFAPIHDFLFNPKTAYRN
ncbi:MAG: hypothetical protein F6K54_25415 [Okeania sp. SIO3B5]|uniref:hypothetical protein n=1 Tax=Okeania sp. SIO3B5 TaxID=2607811 RepID=UPI00140072BE|nr:hypothetical protein [Okeania sp. SIO3B5]NEO56120.1 hypothetical protein [Okeania sp. SIO3B5]